MGGSRDSARKKTDRPRIYLEPNKSTGTERPDGLKEQYGTSTHRSGRTREERQCTLDWQSFGSPIIPERRGKKKGKEEGGGEPPPNLSLVSAIEKRVKPEGSALGVSEQSKEGSMKNHGKKNIEPLHERNKRIMC